MYPIQNLIGGFRPADYDTSSEYNAYDAWEQVFSNGSPYTTD
ncbi:MAG: hypothetical protein Q8M08_03060 [Bacteroidales bacterium]|nr:hypothetical protein [Bacteroidales bacterium]